MAEYGDIVGVTGVDNRVQPSGEERYVGVDDIDVPVSASRIPIRKASSPPRSSIRTARDLSSRAIAY